MDNACSAPTKTDNGIMRFGAQDNGIMRFGVHVNISHNRQFWGYIFKLVWAVYGGDLTGFCQSFGKRYFKK